MPKLERNAYLWALYDFSNSIFLTNFLIIYFPQWILNEKNLPDIVYSIAVALVSLSTGLLLPNIGALTDLHQSRLYFFRIFVVLAWLASFFTAIIAIFLPGLAGIILAIIFFSLAYFFFQPTLVIYDSMLSGIVEKEKRAMLSGIGVIFGYTGQIVGLLVVAPIIVRFKSLGASSAFLPTSLLFIIFALPTLIWLKDPSQNFFRLKKLKLGESLSRVKETFQNIRSYSNVLSFFLSYFFYSNAIVAVTAFTVVYAEKVLGFTGQAKIPLYIAATGLAIIGAFLCGLLSNRIGLKKILFLTLIGWIICFTFGSAATSLFHGWILALFLGILTGITWTISRLIVIKISPKDKLTEFFGFFGLAGRLATTVGPLWWGFVVLAFSQYEVLRYRISLFSMSLLIIVSLLLLNRVRFLESSN